MSHKVKIAARLRPRLQGEVDDGGLRVVHSDDGGTSHIAVPNPRDANQIFKFPFTSCYDEHATQDAIFDRDVHPLVDTVYSGVTVTVFAYGVTSSGKTHTMQGTRELPGVIPRAVAAMFDRRQDSHKLTMSYFEIHKDEVYDLLVNRAEAPKLPVRENDSGQVFVANLSVEPIDSMGAFNAHFSRANKQRSVGATNLNNQSSRSHAILTIEVQTPDEAAGRVITGKINLVDLAGSENNKLTGNDPSRMAESAAINKSLSVLGQVVHALNTGASRIPYRNSKLTRILQDALGGQAVCLLICNLAPSMKFRQDTLNTLNFAVRTKNVENRPVVHERDTRPAPKPHFAAMRPARPAVQIPAHATGPLPPIPTPVKEEEEDGHLGELAPPPMSRVGSGRGSLRSRRPSLLPQPMSRPSSATAQRAALTPAADIDMDEKIKRLVEAEVARRMEDMLTAERAERDRMATIAAAREREAVPSGGSASMSASASTSAGPSRVLSAGSDPAETSQLLAQAPPFEDEPADRALDALLPPALLERHAALDAELMARLDELAPGGAADVAAQLTPVRRKRTGRAYVALARGHSDRGDLQLALDYYRKAEQYVPENAKLKERIVEIEHCVREGQPFAKSPKAKSKKGAKKKGRARARTSGTSRGDDGGDGDSDMEVDGALRRVKDETPAPDGGDVFGPDTGSPGKRPRSAAADVKLEEDADAGEGVAAPKRKRRSKAPVEVKVEESDEDGEGGDVVQPRRSKRVAAR